MKFLNVIILDEIDTESDIPKFINTGDSAYIPIVKIQEVIVKEFDCTIDDKQASGIAILTYESEGKYATLLVDKSSVLYEMRKLNNEKI